MRGPYAQRSHRPARHPFDRKRILRGRPAFARPARDEKQNRFVEQPSYGELESGRRGRVEPLHVVDRNQQWLGLCERAQAGQNRDANRPRIRRPPPGLGKQERYLERAAPWRRHRRQHLVEHAVEQVAETGMSEAALGPRRSGRQYPQ